jgi:diguanylate cyclase (GGDEF)-like protein
MTYFETSIKNYFNYLESKGKTFNILLGLAWTALFGTLDILSSSHTSFSFLYLFPIAFVTWFGGKTAGLAISLCCTVLWSKDNIVDNHFISAWNIVSTFAIFCTISLMLSKIHSLWNKEIELSRKDPLTGAMNLRAFSDMVEYEILLLQRYTSPFSFAFLDLDDFKKVNDLYGHQKGDELLIAVVRNLVGSLRKTDVIARIGGDEFAILLPATDHTTVRIVMEKVRELLHELSKGEQWAITFSMGVVTCENNGLKLKELFSIADRLMYEAKNNGKNNICYAIHAPEN